MPVPSTTHAHLRYRSQITIPVFVLALVLLPLVARASDTDAGSTTEPAVHVKVLSYNIHHGRGSDGKVDLVRVAEVIRKSQADLVALQEVDQRTRRSAKVDQASRLGELSGLTPVFGKAMEFDGGAYGVAVLSRYPIRSSSTLALPSEDGHEPRAALVVTVMLPGGQPLHFASTHLDHARRAGLRTSQAQAITDNYGRGASPPMILAGDLNATPKSATMRVLTRDWLPASLKDLAPTSPADEPKRKIDYVLLRKEDGWRVVDSEVLAAPKVSDHAPILVTLQYSPDNFDRRQLQQSPDEFGYRDASGRLRRVTDARDEQIWRDDLRHRVQSIMGPLPEDSQRCALDVETESEVDCGSYTRRLISYASEPGNRVPAYLLVPKPAAEAARLAPAPAVLCLHPTDNQVGHKVVVGLGGRENRQYAQELAERGFVTLAPAYPLLANYQPDLTQLGYRSGTMKAIWDNMRAIDLLASLPFVEPDRIGVIGHSLGGHNGVYTAAFDARLKAVVTCCGLDSYLDYMDGDIRGWTSNRYMPELLAYAHRLHQVPFDFDELIASLAPRPCLIIAPRGDTNFRWKSVDRVAGAAAKIYQLRARPSHLQVVHPDCGHDFPKDMREKAYAFLGAALSSDGDAALQLSTTRNVDE